MDFEELQVLPMTEADILRINQGTLLQQKDHLEDTFIHMYSEARLVSCASVTDRVVVMSHMAQLFDAILFFSF